MWRCCDTGAGRACRVLSRTISLSSSGVVDSWEVRCRLMLKIVPTATIFFKFAPIVRGLSRMAKPKCFFDIEIGGGAAGRVVMEVSKMATSSCGIMADA